MTTIDESRSAGRGAGRAVAALALAAGLLGGCDSLPFGYTPVKEILAAPASFEGREVKVKGTVTDVTRIPLVNLQSFVLQEEGAEITVVTEGKLPAKGERVASKGTVTSAAIIGGKSLNLRIREIERL
ncbi:MAG: hypothetical protein HYU77_05485 [Betaproteobacteria bacterium]|nr:hypothetical protein [Betaproteobacteria bacterium]